MFNFLKNLFSKQITFPLGAIENPQDKRTINQVTFQKPVNLPDDYSTTLPPVEYQTQPECVAEAIHKIKELYLQEAGKYIDLSADDLYAQCKAQDGIPDQLGTYPLIGAKIAVASGIASVDAVKTGEIDIMAASRAKYKLGGFASVNPDFMSVCQAIYQNKAITASFQVDNNWFLGIITRVLKSIGRHYVVLHGFKLSSTIVRGQNSWGANWIGKVAGIIDPYLDLGHFDVYWPDVADSVTDLYLFTDSIPKSIIDHVKSLDYYFEKGMKLGDINYAVLQLQKRLTSEGIFPIIQEPTQCYGHITQAAVKEYQRQNGIFSDGSIIGPQTLRALNKSIKLSLVQAMIHVESQGNDYAVGDLNLKDHAYGCLQIRQGVVDQVNAKYGTKYRSQDCLGNRYLSLGIFDNYWKIFTDMDTDEERARAWNGGPGWKNIYKKPGYETYSKNIDAYWSKVHALMI